MLDGEFEKYDIDERIRRITDDYFKGQQNQVRFGAIRAKSDLFFVGKTPGDAGPIPKMSELVGKSSSKTSLDFWVWPKTVAREDGIEMRRMIQMIDDTIRKKKAGTVTGKIQFQRTADTVLDENSFRSKITQNTNYCTQ